MLENVLDTADIVRDGDLSTNEFLEIDRVAEDAFQHKKKKPQYLQMFKQYDPSNTPGIVHGF